MINLKDATITNKLWKFLNTEWGEREYKEIAQDEIKQEVDELVAYIKENY